MYNHVPKIKFLFKAKDGGPESNVTGYWLIEWKKVFSIALLRFSKGSREAFHNHAFNAWSWILSGELSEWTKEAYAKGWVAVFSWTSLKPSLKPIFTPRERLHKVEGIADVTWALTFRGPWADKWQEYFDKDGKTVTLTHGRKEIA